MAKTFASSEKSIKPKSQKFKAEEYKPLNPWFCTVKDPETGEKCGKMMGVWDQISYDKYGMCEECCKKYNPHLEIPKRD